MSDVATNFLGKHRLVELYGCPFELLDDLAIVQAALVATTEAVGATVLNAAFHKFSPQGVTGVILVMESHLSVHTWPEFGYAAVDIFTCGDLDLAAGEAVMAQHLGATSILSQELKRGTEPVGRPSHP